MKAILDYLNVEFEQRKERNNSYSLRAYAKSLGIPVSTLSEALSGKRALSKSSAVKIGKALKMSEQQLAEIKAGERTQDDSYNQISLDSFYIISQWWHYAILQLIKTKDFKNEPKWIASRLGIRSADVKGAIERLIRVGILDDIDGSLVDTTEGNTSHIVNNFTNEQLKNFQIILLEQAIESIKKDDISLRDNTAMTVAISSEAVDVAKNEIKKFRRKLTKKLEKISKTSDEVYQLTIGLNPVTRNQVLKKEGETK